MSKNDNRPVLVTGAAGAVGGIGRTVTETLLARGLKVRALVRREDTRSAALRQLGADVVVGDLTDLTSMHRANGRPIAYRDVSVATWADNLRDAGVPAHVVDHLSVMAQLHQQGRYDRETDELPALTGKPATTMASNGWAWRTNALP